jgi:hypothetical protein
LFGLVTAQQDVNYSKSNFSIPFGLDLYIVQKIMANIQWSDDELKECIKAYFKMLKYEEKGTPYSKVEINNHLRNYYLNKRTKSSVEYRMQNISSVLNERSHNYITGYKPASNVGSNVKERIWKIINDLKLI